MIVPSMQPSVGGCGRRIVVRDEYVSLGIDFWMGRPGGEETMPFGQP